MEWWIWILLGLVLLLAEVLTPGGFYIVFFGVGAVVVGILAGLNAAGPPVVSVHTVLADLGSRPMALP